MDQKCTVQHIAKIAKFLPKWNVVATLLGFEQENIRDIIHLYSDSERGRYEMLTRWVEKEGSQATYRKIYDTLLSLEEMEAAQNVLKLIGVLPPMQSPPPAPSTQRQESLGPPTLKLLMNFPTQEGTINIIQEIGVAYSKLGIFLLNDKNGNRIAALQREHHQNAEDITMAMFQTWFREGTEKSITWNTLVTALGNASLNSLADKIAKAVFQTPPSVEPSSALCPEPNMPSKKAKKKELGPKYEVKPVEVEPDEVEPDEEEPDEVEPDGGDEDESRVSLGGNSAHVVEVDALNGQRLARKTFWVEHYCVSFPCDAQPQNHTPEGVPTIGLGPLLVP
eukprot:Em0015g1170a